MEKLSVNLRVKKDLIKEYRLDEVVKDNTIRSNIAFALQYIHFNLDILENYDLQKSLKALTCKQLLVNTFSVLEGIMLGAIDTVKTWCNSITSCQYACEYYFMKDTTEFIRFDEMKSYLRNIGALDFSEQGMKFIKTAKGLRNNVHIGKSSEIESENVDYNTEFVEESLRTIEEVAGVLADFMKNQRNKNPQSCLTDRFSG